MTSEHCAFASMFIFPHAEMAACAVFGNAANAVKATIAEAREAQELPEIFFMAVPRATDEPDETGALAQRLSRAKRDRASNGHALTPRVGEKPLERE